jgi:lipopolysaccharide export system permease protein
MLQKDGHIKHPKINYEIYVKNIRGRRLIDAQFMRRSPDGKSFDVIARAKEAELRVDLAHKQILVDMRQCYVRTEHEDDLFIESRIWAVEIADFNGSREKFRAMDMVWDELDEYEEKHLKNIEKLTQEINLLQSQENLSLTQAQKDRLRSLVNDRNNREQQIYSIRSERHMRPALAFGCLCFALVGCPVGIWFSKSDYLSAFITCFLPIVIIYYPVTFCMFNMASSGKIIPWLGAYDADALLLLSGGFLFWRLARH